MARRQQVEASLQIAIVGWLHDVLPASVVHHSPNGGDRKPWYVERLKNMAFVHPVDVAPIFLEVKTRTGRLSEAQQSLHSDLSRFKVHLYTVKSIDDCRNALTGLVTLRPATPHGKIIEEQAKILAGS